jgi:hypothetical protein
MVENDKKKDGKSMEKGEFLLSLNEVYESNIDFLIF